MAGAVPHEVLGLAISINVLGFFAVFLGLLLCFMLWNLGERVSYILMMSASTTLGSMVGFVRHLDYTLNWRYIKIERFKESQQSGFEQSSLYGKSDTGWRSVLNWISIYTYNVDALLVMFWAIALFIGAWDVRIKSDCRKVMSIVFKITSVILPAILLPLCSVDSVENVPGAYLALFNAIIFICLTTGSLLVVTVLCKYLKSRDVFNRFFRKSSLVSGSFNRSGTRTVSSSATARTKSTTDKWLIVRFSIIMAILLIFEAAQIIYEIVNFKRNQHTANIAQTKPDFSVAQTNIDLLQYIPGIAPSIIAFCVFGTTVSFRRAYARAIRKCFGCTEKRRARKDPIPWMMLQPRARKDTTSATFTDDVEVLSAWGTPEESKVAAEIQVRTEISTTTISGEPITADASSWDSTDTITPVYPRENGRKVSFGGTSIHSSQGPLSPPVAYRSQHRKQRPLSHERFGVHGSHGDSQNGQSQDVWVWSSPSREPSVSSLNSQRRPSWTLPSTPVTPPPRSRALPLLRELDTHEQPISPTQRNSVSPRTSRSSKDDPLFHLPPSAQPPLSDDVPPVPPIAACSDWRKDSVTASLRRPSTLYSHHSTPSQRTVVASPGIFGSREPAAVRGPEPTWLVTTQSTRSSGESEEPTGHSDSASADGLIPGHRRGASDTAGNASSPSRPTNPSSFQSNHARITSADPPAPSQCPEASPTKKPSQSNWI